MPKYHWALLSTGHLFGILNLGYCDLFEIWILVFGIFVDFDKVVNYLYCRSITCLNDGVIILINHQTVNIYPAEHLGAVAGPGGKKLF